MIAQGSGGFPADAWAAETETWRRLTGRSDRSVDLRPMHDSLIADDDLSRGPISVQNAASLHFGRKLTLQPDLHRFLGPPVLAASATFPVVLVTGARQVGKTTLLRAVAEPERRYVTLDDPLQLRLAREDPALFIQTWAPPVLIDEIQYAPELLPHIKMAVDRQRSVRGAYWLTGSQPFHLMQGVSESLAGRVAVLPLLGLSSREAQALPDAGPFLPGRDAALARQASGQRCDLAGLYAQIWRGSYPALVANPTMDRDLFYASYLQTYLQRDVRDLARVGDQTAFLRFLRAAAARTAQLLNIADLARDADVAPNTAKHWLSVLEASGIAWLLPPWSSNLTKRLTKTPKLYLLDTGLAAWLTQWTSPQTLEAGAMSGAIFETWVLTQILKSHQHAGRQTPLFYYRDKDQREVDLLIEADGRLHPVECKKSASPGAAALAGMRTLAGTGAPMGEGTVVCMVSDGLPLTGAPIPVWALPAWAL